MITGTVTPDDYLAAQRLHRHRISIWSYASGVVAVLFGLFAWYFSERFIALVFAAMGVGALLGEAITNHWLLPRRARKLHQQQRDFAHPFTYSWNADSIEGTGVSGHSKRPWSGYHKVREGENLILLYHNDNVFEVFPKRWFADTSTLEQFLDFARNAKET